jgi:hypothetical protein
MFYVGSDQGKEGVLDQEEHCRRHQVHRRSGQHWYECFLEHRKINSNICIVLIKFDVASDFPGAKQVSEGIAKVGTALLSSPLFATFDKVALLLPGAEETPREALAVVEKEAAVGEENVERGCDARCIDRCIGTHIYRLHGGAATSSNIQERRGPSVNIQDTYVPYIYTQHPPAVEASPEPTQRLDRNSSKDDVGSPLVMISANCWEVGTCRTRIRPRATCSRTK